MMAGALLGGASKVVSGAGEDPVGWLIGFLIKAGSILLGVGLVLSYAAYLLNVYASKTLGDIGTEAAQIWGVFGNVAYNPQNQPLLPVATSNPLSDIQNFGADIYRGLDNSWSDMSSALGTISQSLQDIPPALLAIATHGPKILWDGLVGLVGEGLGDLLTFLFPWLIITGILMLALGLVLKGLQWVWRVAIGPDVSLLAGDYLALWTLPLKTRVTALHERLQAKLSPIKPTEAQAEAPGQRLESPNASEPVPEPETASEARELTLLPQEQGTVPVNGGPTGSVEEAPLPASGPQTTEEVLGESYPEPSYNEAKDRMRLALSS